MDGSNHVPNTSPPHIASNTVQAIAVCRLHTSAQRKHSHAHVPPCALSPRSATLVATPSPHMPAPPRLTLRTSPAPTPLWTPPILCAFNAMHPWARTPMAAFHPLPCSGTSTPLNPTPTTPSTSNNSLCFSHRPPHPLLVHKSLHQSST